MMCITMLASHWKFHQITAFLTARLFLFIGASLWALPARIVCYFHIPASECKWIERQKLNVVCINQFPATCSGQPVFLYIAFAWVQPPSTPSQTINICHCVWQPIFNARAITHTHTHACRCTYANWIRVPLILNDLIFQPALLLTRTSNSTWVRTSVNKPRTC